MKSKNPLDKIFYVYVYLDPRKPGVYRYENYKFDYEPFYVGKGHDNRAFNHLKQTFNNYFRNKIKKIKSNLLIDPIIIFHIKDINEQESFKEEQELIQKIGRIDIKTGPLCNLSEGGEGRIGYKYSDELRLKLSNLTSGNKNGMYGKKQSEKTKLLIGEKNKNYIRTEEFKRKISIKTVGENNPMYGKTRTKNERKKISIGVQNYWDNISDDKLKQFKNIRSKLSKGENNPMYGKKRLDCAGDLNPAKREDVREKISYKLKESWKKRKLLKNL